MPSGTTELPPVAGTTDDLLARVQHRVAGYLKQQGLVTLPLLIAIIALSVYASSQSDIFLTRTNLENIVHQIAVLGLLTVGMTVLMVAGYFDISVGALASLICVIGAKMAGAGQSDVVITLAAMAIGVSTGLLTGWIVGTVQVAPFILTLGALSVYQGLALIISDGRPIPLDFDHFASLGLGSRWLGVPAPGVVLAGALIVGALFLRYTRAGRNAYALGSSPQAAFLVGMPIVRLTMVVFAFSGLMVGLAGVVLLARLGAGDPQSGIGLELQAIAAVVLGGAALTGGRGSMWGSFLGVVLLGVIANSLTLLGVQAFYQRLVYGFVLIVAVVATAVREKEGGVRSLVGTRARGSSRRGTDATEVGDGKERPA